MFQSYFLPKRYAPHKAPVWGFISAGNPLDPDPFTSIRRLPVAPPFRKFGMVAFRVDGDSMTLPDGNGFPHGAWVLADRHDLITSDGHLYAFRLPDGSMIVKRYRLYRGRPAMHSDNPEYQPVQITSSVRNVGRVYATSLDGRTWTATRYRAVN